MVNYQLIQLYQELFQMQQIINNEILPLASQVGLDKEDPKLVKSAENFASELERHLSEYNIESSKTTVTPITKRKEY